MKDFIKKRKTILIIALAAIVIVIISSITVYLPQKVKEVPITTDQVVNETNQVSTGTFFLPVGVKNTVDTKSAQTIKAIASKNKVLSSLPIYVEDFKTSNDRLTTLNVYTIPEDPDYLVHIEIYGIDYQIQNTNLGENPDAVAFIDSFKEIKKRLTDKGINIKDLYFVFSGREYIEKTAELWVNEFKLLQ
jgi:hypothetical protein